MFVFLTNLLPVFCITRRSAHARLFHCPLYKRPGSYSAHSNPARVLDLPGSRIRWIIDKCTCLRSRKMYASPCEHIMAPLPTPRVTACENPFASTGVDYFGPLMVKRGRSMVKRYGCVFTCMAIRAVHIEIAHSSPSCVPFVVLRRVEASQLICTATTRQTLSELPEY